MTVPGLSRSFRDGWPPYSSYIITPKWIPGKKATINIQNEDQKCFKYCILYHKHKNEIKCHPGRISYYKNWENSKEFKFDGIIGYQIFEMIEGLISSLI
jgi:hypothetical protein